VEAYRVQQRSTVGAGGVGRRRAVLVAEGDAEQQPMIVSKAETAAHDRRVQAEHALRAQVMPREVSASIRVCAYMPMSVASRVSNSRCMKTNTATSTHASRPPSAAKRCAIARPRPRAVPVTTQTLRCEPVATNR
jgi:hypothetical protein